MIVGFNNVLHQLVTDHIPFVEVDESYAFDVSQNFPHLDQAGDPFRRQIDLRNISGDHHLGVKPKPREKHLHLFGRGILCFIENNERIVQRTAAHKPERRNLDIAPFNRARSPLHIHHVEQRVIQRTEIGIHFGVHIARQESEFLACLNSRPRENDAAHFFLHKGTDCHRHCQIGLACAGGADADHDIVRLDGFDIRFLRRRFRCDESFLGHDRRRIGEEFLDRSLGTLSEGIQRMGNVVRLEDHSVVGEGGKFREDSFRVAGSIGCTIEGEFFSARRKAHAQICFDQLEVPVVVTEQHGSIGAFSEFKSTHALGLEFLPRFVILIIAKSKKERQLDVPEMRPKNRGG